MGRRVAEANVEDRLAVFPTSLGWVATAWHGERLQTLVFGHKGPQAAIAAIRNLGVVQGGDPAVTSEPDEFARRLNAYADGNPDNFLDVPLDLGKLTDFQRRALEQCRRIAYGQTLTYLQLAARAGCPGAARAAGSVMARNKIPLVIPCHRVIASNGSLGGYSGPNGLAMKKRLLEIEARGRVPKSQSR
jgi:methylated-DNA-[protein]-cysteine S-methyltransferase